MIAGAVAASQRSVPPYAGPFPEVVGAAFAAESSVVHTVDVPAGAQTGDLLVAVLSTRGDRTFATPAGWTARLAGYLTGAGSAGKADYIFTKPYAGESQVSFTKNVVGAACVGVLAVRNGVYGKHTSAQEANTSGSNVAGSIAPTAASSLLIAATTGIWVTPNPAATTFPPITVIGQRYFSETNGSGGQAVAFASRGACTTNTLSMIAQWGRSGAATCHRVLHLIEMSYTG